MVTSGPAPLHALWAPWVGLLMLLTAMSPPAGSGQVTSAPASGAVDQAPTAFAALASVTPSAAGPSVESTIVLSNQSVLPGNVVAGNGNRPYALAYDATHKIVYVGSWDTNFLTMVDALNHTVTGYVPINTTGVLALLVVGDHLYVCGYSVNLVQVVNLTLRQVMANITIGVSPVAFAWDPVHDRVLVTVATRPWYLYAVSDTNFTIVASQAIRNSPGIVVYDPFDDRILVGDGGSNVGVLNGTTFAYITNLTMGFDPWAGIWDPANDLVYMAAQESDNLSIIDPVTPVVIGTLQIGGEPNAVALDPTGRWLYVPSAERSNVTRIDTADPSQHLSIPTGPGPVGITYDVATGEGVTANFQANNLTFFNGSTGALDFTVANGFTPQGGLYDPTTDEVYVSESSEGTVLVWNVSQGRIADVIPVGGSPTHMVYDASTGQILVLRSYAGLVSAIDERSHTIVSSIPVAPGSVGIALDAPDGLVFVADYAGVGIQEFHLSNGTALTPINVTQPNAIAYCPRTGLVYAVVGFLDDQIIAIDPHSGVIVANGTVGLVGTSILCDPFADRVFVTNQRTQNVSVLDATSLLGVDSYFVGAGGAGADYDLWNAELAVSDSYDNTLSFVGVLNATLVATLSVGVGPGPVVYVPTTDTFFVGNVGSGTISIVTPGTPPPTLRSLAISPPTLSVVEGDSAGVAAVATSDYGVPLVSGVTYSWSVNPSILGTELGSTTDSAVFTGGAATGTGYLSVNATYRGIQLRASIPVQVVGPPPVPLAAAFLTPTSVHLLLGDLQTFRVNASLVGGAPSPPTTVFVWSVTPLSLGVLNTTSGDSVIFSPTTVGSGTVSVAAYYAGSTAVTAAQVVVSVSAPGPELAYVTISPPSTSITWGTNANFSASAFASDGTDLTATATFSWSLEAPRHGSIRFTSGAMETYVAPSENASDVVTVTATLAGVTTNASATVTVFAPAPNGTPAPAAPVNPWLQTRLGLPTWGWIVLVAALALVIALLALRYRRRNPPVERAQAFALDETEGEPSGDDAFGPDTPAPPSSE